MVLTVTSLSVASSFNIGVGDVEAERDVSIAFQQDVPQQHTNADTFDESGRGDWSSCIGANGSLWRSYDTTNQLYLELFRTGYIVMETRYQLIASLNAELRTNWSTLLLPYCNGSFSSAGLNKKPSLHIVRTAPELFKGTTGPSLFVNTAIHPERRRLNAPL